jgi:hypothetical protein
MPRPPGIAGRATLTQSASNVQVKIRARPETFRATTSTDATAAGRPRWTSPLLTWPSLADKRKRPRGTDLTDGGIDGRYEAERMGRLSQPKSPRFGG